MQEVFSNSKPRLSISGWFHAELPPEYAELATLNQLVADGQHAAPFTAIPRQMPEAGAAVGLSDGDKSLLGQWLNPSYLDPA